MDKRKLASLEPTTHDGTVIKPPSPRKKRTFISLRRPNTRSTNASPPSQSTPSTSQEQVASASFNSTRTSTSLSLHIQTTTATTRAVSTTDGFNQRPGPPADLQKDSFEKECPLQAERLERQAQAFVSFQQHVQETFSDSQSDHTHTTIQDGRKLGQSHGRSRSSLVSLDATNSSQSSETQFFTMQSEHDYNPDCNEEQDPQCKDEEFADLCLDEIEDWGDDFDIEHEPPGCAPVPDVACPLCGLDLSALDTMTPDAHVNRCLDGTGVESQNLPDQTEIPSILPNVASQLRTGNPISSILGSIRSVITNLPLRPYLPPPSTPTTATPKPPPKQSKPKTYRPCPFYKKMPDTDFTVDAFMYGAVEGCGAYFLSHFHSDHYGGLTSTWSHGLIYCSSITANLVISRLRVDEKWVRRLPMHKPTLVNGVTVTLMDANHCPGSVLFVFDLHSPKRRYLHTGDFRALPDMCLDPILCQPPNVPIDILYLDTTYSNPRYTFPSQKLVISETVRTINKELGLVNDTVVPPKPAPAKKANIMESWLKRESGNAQKLVTMSTKPTKMSKSAADWSRQMETNKVVICVGTYLIGKERVWMAVAKALRSKVFVQPAKLQILSCLEDQEIIDMLTCNPREAQVHLMHMGSDMSPESLQEYLDKLSPTFTRLIAIRPTGWTFSGGPKKDSVSTTDITPEQTPTTLQLRPSYTSPMVKIYPVPYSEHSSFNELAGFVRSLNIMRIIPTVGVGSEKGRHAMSEWFDRWEQERRKGIGWL
ncbi:DNA break repair nuclease [Podila epicladia]|nr:DNA break repair nuclease [Podila epicladia]